MASTSAFCQRACWIVRRRTLPATQLPKIWATMSFSRPPMAAFLGQKGNPKVCLLNVRVFHGCMLGLQYMQHSEMGSYGLSVCFQSRYFKFKSLMKSHEVSLILMVQWLPELRVEVWESYLNIPETDPRHVSRHVVGFEALEVFATHDMGHSMSQYEVVLCQCGDCMRLCCLRCGLEWSGRQMSIVNALQERWRRGQVQVATVCGPVWKLGSQKKSWFQMVSVSDGFGTFWQCSHLSVL